MTVTNPIIVKIDPADNVAIVANDGGLQAGTEVPGGIVLKDLLIGNSIVPIRFAGQGFRFPRLSTRHCWVFKFFGTMHREIFAAKLRIQEYPRYPPDTEPTQKHTLGNLQETNGQSFSTITRQLNSHWV